MYSELFSEGDPIVRMLTTIKEHSGEGLLGSLVECMSKLKCKPALAWAALWMGLVFGLVLHQRPASQEARPAEYPSRSSTSPGLDINDPSWMAFQRFVLGPAIVGDLPCSVIDSLQPVAEAVGIPGSKVPDMYKAVHAAFLSCLGLDDLLGDHNESEDDYYNTDFWCDEWGPRSL
eukprot:gene10325-8258_t